MIERIRTKALWAVIVLALLVIPLAVLVSPWWWLLEIVFVPLVILGIYDYFQPRHSILRNYPLAGRMRFLLEGMGPELHQYLVENDTDGRPFDRDTRSVIYERAKNVGDKKPFGTELNVYDAGYSWMSHSISPRPMVADPEQDLRVTVGGEQCTQPYSASVLNISAMSFGALGAGRGPGHEPGRQGRRLRPRHRRGRPVEVPQGGRWRPDLADRHRLLRLPRRQRRLRPRGVPQERHPAAGQDDRDQGLPGRQARTRRHPAGGQGHRGDRRGPDGPAGQGRVLADVPQGLLDAAGDDGVHRPAPRAQRRQAGRLQALRRRPSRVRGPSSRR